MPVHASLKTFHALGFINMRTSALETLQNVVTAYLAATLEVPVIAHQGAGNLDAWIEETIQSHAGACVIVGLPLPMQVHPHLPGPVFESVGLTIRVIENGLLGKTQLLQTAERVSTQLHQFNPNLKAFPTRLILSPKMPWKRVTDRDAPMRSMIDLEFMASGELSL